MPLYAKANNNRTVRNSGYLKSGSNDEDVGDAVGDVEAAAAADEEHLIEGEIEDESTDDDAVLPKI